MHGNYKRSKVAGSFGAFLPHCLGELLLNNEHSPLNVSADEEEKPFP